MPEHHSDDALRILFEESVDHLWVNRAGLRRLTNVGSLTSADEARFHRGTRRGVPLFDRPLYAPIQVDTLRYDTVSMKFRAIEHYVSYDVRDTYSTGVNAYENAAQTCVDVVGDGEDKMIVDTIDYQKNIAGSKLNISILADGQDGQVIPANYDPSADGNIGEFSGMTWEKLEAANEYFANRGYRDNMSGLHVLYDTEIRNHLTLNDKYRNADYNRSYVLENGVFKDNTYGFDWQLLTSSVQHGGVSLPRSNGIYAADTSVNVKHVYVFPTDAIFLRERMPGMKTHLDYIVANNTWRWGAEHTGIGVLVHKPEYLLRIDCVTKR